MEQTLDRLTSAGSGWLSYFAEELLSRLDAGVRSFLLASSILPRLDASLCNQVLDIDSSAAVLNSLCERNLFTFRTGEQRGSFRYHRLFREFLQDQLRINTPGRKLAAIRKRAAAALERRGDWVEALLAFAECGDWNSALRLIRGKNKQLLATGRYNLLEEALALLPEDRTQGSYAAMLFLGLIHDGMGRWPEAMRDYKAAWRLHSTRRDRIQLLSQMAVLHLRWGEYAQCRSLCRKALDEPGRKSPAARASIHEMLGVSASELGLLDEAERHLVSAREHWRSTMRKRQPGALSGSLKRWITQ